ncbi:MAG: ATP-binding cassette domain-containing protein [Bacillota bacterium]
MAGISTQGRSAVLETSGLTKFYGKSRGVIDLNLDLAEGEIFGFIGPNGAGKTTTIRCLLNFIFPTKGTARIFGKDVVRDSKEIKANVGYLPGEVAYYGDVRVRDLLSYSSAFYGRDCLGRAKELADVLELDLDRRIETLSLGNRKKIGVIQALMHEPKLLILDEPTSGLDPLMQKRFYDLLLEENRKGVTVFFSSHVLSEVQKLCHRVAILKEGRLLRIEKIEELRGRQLLRVTATFADARAGAALVASLHGVVDPRQDGDTLRFTFSGNIDSLIKALSQVHVTALHLEEPTLEEIFMHYYEKEGER